jgi:NADH:ubiquinone oxidoreductase subunit 3 (subunit A)
MEQWIVSPPSVFGIVFIAIAGLSYLCSRLSFRAKKQEQGTRESYACGEENYDHMAQPDYCQFFPFAFFFTLAHVATLIATTVPVANSKVFILALLYILGALTGLSILLKR